jgi:hypothetical protein
VVGSRKTINFVGRAKFKQGKSCTAGRDRHKVCGMKMDWPKARAEYVNNSTLTYADIAKKYGVNANTLRNRNSPEQSGEFPFAIS